MQMHSSSNEWNKCNTVTDQSTGMVLVWPVAVWNDVRLEDFNDIWHDISKFYMNEYSREKVAVNWRIYF